MIVTRRTFLKGMAGILAASQMPAILARENVMDIYVPSQKIAVVSSLSGLTEEEMRQLQTVNFTVTGLVKGSRVTVFNRDTREIIMNEVAVEDRVEKDLVHYADRDIDVMIRKTGFIEQFHQTTVSKEPFKIVSAQTKDAIFVPEKTIIR